MPEIKSIDTRRKAAAQLRKLGYERSQMSLTRGVSTYVKKGEGWRSRLKVHLSAQDTIWVQDSEGDYSVLPNLMSVGNLSASAGDALQDVIDDLRQFDMLPKDTVTQYDLAVAIVKLVESAS